MSKMHKDIYYLLIAHTVSKRASCLKRQVGAIVVVDDAIVSTGYNGTPRGSVNCEDGGCPRCKGAGAGVDYSKCYCAHAEENVLVQAARNGMKVMGGTVYCLLSPCLPCARMMVNAGVRRVVFLERWDEGEPALKLLTQSNVAYENIPLGGNIL